MTRLLHLIHSFPPESRGGIETHVEQLAAAQVAAGHGVVVVAGSEGARGGEVRRETVTLAGGGAAEVWRLPPETERERFAAGSASANGPRFEALLDELAPDLLHVHHFAATGPGPVRAAAARGVPAVVSLHDLFTVCPLFFRLRGDRELCAADVAPATCVACLAEASGARAEDVAPALDARAAAFRSELAAAKAVLALSPSLVDYLRRVPLLAGLRVDSIGFPAAAEPAGGPLDLHLPDLPLHLATWGGLVRGKGLHLLVEAAARLGPGAVELHHHGGILDADYRAELERAADAAALPLTFHGPYDPGALRARLAGCDLAVHPSLYLETHGFTTDEALRLGLPVLVPDRGAPRERIGRRGRTFRAGDVDDLHRHLAEFVSHPERLLALRAREHGELLDLATFVERLDAVYARARGATP